MARWGTNYQQVASFPELFCRPLSFFRTLDFVFLQCFDTVGRVIGRASVPLMPKGSVSGRVEKESRERPADSSATWKTMEVVTVDVLFNAMNCMLPMFCVFL